MAAEANDHNESLEEETSLQVTAQAEETVQPEEAAEPGEAAHSEESAQPAAAARTADEPLQEEQMNEMIEQLCLSKAEEFRLIGYDHVNGQDVWECVSDKYHKKGTPPLYQVVNDILSLKVTQFMNFITLSMYRGDNRD